MSKKMQKPIDNSYWVVPGTFLAGEYPRNKDLESSIIKIRGILRAGVTCFIDLTEPQDGLEPYTDLLADFPGKKISYTKFSIHDVSVPDDIGHMSDILDAIDAALYRGETVYVHCWGGIGRTGVVVGCWLSRHGFEGESALGKLEDLWNDCPKSVSRRSPETREQEQYILNWKEGLSGGRIDRYKGCLLGLASGDALGTTLEFKPPGTFKPLKDMAGGGPFNLKPGQWTDDTSMALCLAESLIEKDGFEAADQMDRYLMWREDGHLSSNGRCFDIGNTVSFALESYKKTGNPFSGSARTHSAGNGSIMRLAPVPMFFAGDVKTAIHFCAESSKTTHGTTTCIDACRYFGALIIGALSGAAKDAVLADHYSPARRLWENDPLCPEISEIASGSFKRRNPPEIAGTGYVVKSLEAALWAFYHSETFEQGCLLAVNLGNDADTTGAVYGQIAGAFYGRAGIPERWVNLLALEKQIELFAAELFLKSLAPV